MHMCFSGSPWVKNSVVKFVPWYMVESTIIKHSIVKVWECLYYEFFDIHRCGPHYFSNAQLLDQLFFRQTVITLISQ